MIKGNKIYILLCLASLLLFNMPQMTSGQSWIMLIPAESNLKNGFDSSNTILAQIKFIEESLGLSNETKPILNRLDEIETIVLGETFEGTLDERLARIRKELGIKQNIASNKTITKSSYKEKVFVSEPNKPAKTQKVSTAWDKLAQKHYNPEFTEYAWKGTLITPSRETLQLKIQSSGNENFVFINDNRYKMLGLKVSQSNNIEFTVYTSPNAESKLEFTGKINGLESSGTVIDQLNEKGTWALKGFKNDKPFEYSKKKVKP